MTKTQGTDKVTWVVPLATSATVHRERIAKQKIKIYAQADCIKSSPARCAFVKFYISTSAVGESTLTARRAEVLCQGAQGQGQGEEGGEYEGRDLH